MELKSELRIGYLAPEIPGLSSTFVYKEIFELKKLGYEIESFSIHHAHLNSSTPELEILEKETSYLYEAGTDQIIKANLALLLSQPALYIKVLLLLIHDATKLVVSSPRTAFGLIYRFSVSAVLASRLIEQKVGHLHIHFANVPTDVGMYAAKLANIPFSVTAHANDIFKQYWLMNEKIKRSKFFATISNFNINLLTTQGADPNKLKLVRCGVDSTDFRFNPSSKKREILTFGFLGRLVEKKGAEFLIHAAEILIESEIKNFKIEIGGSGPLHDELTESIKSKSLSDFVSLVGEIPNSSVSSWLESLDYFVLPCAKDSDGDMDGIPVALMESMVKGVPVISTKISGIPELVIDGETGLVATPEDSESLANCLQKAIAEPDEDAKSRIERARDHVQKNFELSTNTLRLLEYIGVPESTEDTEGALRS